jgi:alpha-beta hydrolase superfamily lysophospholipase
MNTPDGLSLHTRHWRAVSTAGSPAWGTAVLVHGLGEHIGRYEHVASMRKAGTCGASTTAATGARAVGGATSPHPTAC